MNQPKRSLAFAAAVAAVLSNLVFAVPAQAQAKAASTRDVDRPTAQPVNGACTVTSVGFGTFLCDLYSVPAGKRLVVETVSYSVSTNSGQVVYNINFGQAVPYSGVPFSLPNVYTLTPVLAVEANGTRTFAGTQALRMYVDENQSLAASGTRGGAGNYAQAFAFSGYLVDR